VIDTPQLSPDAREQFRASLLRSADLLLEQPKAAAILADFLDGRAVLVLTRHGMAVRAVPPEWADEEPDTPPAGDDAPGMYL
jgi:hypothetical protein